MEQMSEELISKDIAPVNKKSNTKHKHALITASKAVRALEKYKTSSVDAKKLLVDKLRDGYLRAQAKYSWVSNNPSLKDAWSKIPKNARKDVQVRHQLFVGASNLENDYSRWKWRSGYFFVSGANGNKKIIFAKLRFFEEDLNNIIKEMKSSQDIVSKGPGGRPRKDDGRDAAWLAIIEIYQDFGKDIFSNVKVAANAIDKILIRNGKAECLAVQSIERIVTKMRKHLEMDRKNLPKP